MIPVEWTPLAGALVGFIVGLTGVGGGALMAPILLVGFGVNLITVVATDLLFATITKITASAFHNKNSLVDWQVAKRMWAGSIPASLAVILIVYLGFAVENDQVVTRILGTLILISAISLLFGSKLQLLQRSRRIAEPEKFKRYQGITTNFAGTLLGGLVTLTSVGAGALGAVILRSIYPLRMTPQKLVATDTIHAIPVSLIAGASYLAMGFVDIALLGLLLLGSVPSALIASKLMNRMPSHAIKAILGLALLAAGLKLLIS